MPFGEAMLCGAEACLWVVRTPCGEATHFGAATPCGAAAAWMLSMRFGAATRYGELRQTMRLSLSQWM